MTCIAPDPVDVIDFQFKAHCRLKIFNKDANNTIKTNCNLLAVAYRFGLIFVGTPNNELQVIQFKDIEAFSKDVSSYKRRVVKLESAPYFVSINCDCTKLALVCTAKDGCPIAKVYDVSSFLKTNVQELKTIRLSSSADCNIVSCDWNPALPDIFTACNSDGSLGVYEFKGSAMEYNQLPAASGAKCFCWSPKGKQIAVGSLDGKITQYKPDLKAVKAVPPPPEYTTITDLCWLSSFQFIGVYKNSEGTHSIVCVDAPKAGPVTYTCHEDICYSNGTVRPQQFYLIHQMHWNVIMVASSNGMELGVLGMTGDKWTQWILNDNSRAELPLNSSKDDTLPIGVTFSVGASKCVIGDETKHVPLLILLSDDGVLCTFFTINSRSGAADICSPLENLPDRSGEQLYIVGSAESSQPSVVSQAVVAPNTVSSKPQQIMVTPTKAPGLFETKPQGLFQPAIPPPGFGQTSGMFSAKPFVSPIPQSQPQPQTQSVSAFQTSTPFVPKPQTLAPIRPVAVPSSVPLLPDAVTVTTPPRQPPPPTIEPAAAPTQPYIPKVPVPKSAEKLDDTKHETFARKLPVNEETEAIIGKLVKDECLTLEGEINSIIARGNATSLTFGSDPQFKEMAKQAADLEEFYQAIKENINTLDNEVYTLKQALMHTWGCYEEARTRFEGSKDPCAKALLQSLPLDPASKYQLEEINRMMYYLETQLNEANRCLDEQWDTFQDALMKSNKLKLPTMESIYQTMVQHSKTFQKQRYLLKNIANRIKSSQLNTVLNSANTEKSSFVSLEHELSLLHINPKSGVVSDYNRIIERQSKVNENKVSRLRALLLNRGVSHVSITKPNLNNSTIQLSTLLAAPLSPIATESRNNTQLSTMKPSTAFGTIQQSDSRIGVAPLTSRPALLATPVCTVSDRFSTIDGNVKATTWATAKPSPFMAVTTHAEPTRPVALNINNESIATTTVIPISTNSWMQNTYTSGKPTVFTTTTATTPITTPVNIFRQNSASQPASSALFAPDLPTTSGGPLFSAKIVKPTPSMFTVPSKPIFGTTSETPTSVFTFSTGVAATTTPSSFSTLNKASSLRGNGTSHAATNPSIFGISSTAKPVLQPVSSNKPALFGSTTITSPTSASSMGGMFGSLRTSNVGVTPATTSSIFGTSASAKTMPSTTLQVGTVIGTATGTSAQSVFAPATSKGTIIPATISTATSVFGFVTTAVDTAFGTVTSVTSTPQILASNTSKAPGVISTTTSSTSAAPVTQSSFGSVTSTKLLQEPLSVSGSVSTTPKSTVGSTSVLGPGLISSASNSGIGSTTSVFASLPVGGTTCATTSPFVQSSVSTPSIFSQSTTTTSLGQVSTTANIFGQASTKSIFSQPVTTNSGIFGQPVSAVVTPFAQVTTTTANIFGQAITSATTTATSIFGKTAPTAATFPQTGTTATSPFTQTVTTVASPFAQTATTVGSPFAQTATTSASPFAQTGSTAATPFGQTATSGTSPFGQSATSSASLFGKPATSASGIFGQAAPPTGIFGQTASTTSTPFGQTNSSTFSSSGSLFGQPATFGSGSIFGGTAAPSAFGSAPVFGTTTSAQSSPFGSSSPFGTTATTSASVFSSPQNQTSFGNAFGGGSTFGAQSQGSIFGGTAASTTSGTFNTFSSLSVGATPKPAFGQPSTSVPNPFSRPADQKTNFGNPGNLFASPVSSAASIFGGSPSNTQTFGNSPFGNSSFGQQQSAFGNTSFGSPTPAGAFSAGTQSVQQSGFGSPSFQKPAFGSGPVFGQPAFGGSASFGGSPSFGGTPTFGSPQKVFGTGAEPTAFGTASTGNATFGSLANQNTVGFGNLAQQASQPAQPLPFSGGSSFTNWRN